MNELAAVMDAQQQSEAVSVHSGKEDGSGAAEQRNTTCGNGPVKDGVRDGMSQCSASNSGSEGMHRRRPRSARSGHVQSEDSSLEEQVPLQQDQQQQLQGVQQHRPPNHWLWPCQWFGGGLSSKTRAVPSYKQYGQCNGMVSGVCKQYSPTNWWLAQQNGQWYVQAV